MADGAYRWQGHAPAPDAARIEAIDAAWDEAGAPVFAEPARAAAVERIDAALTAARTGDLAEAAAGLAHARSVLVGVPPTGSSRRRAPVCSRTAALTSPAFRIAALPAKLAAPAMTPVTALVTSPLGLPVAAPANWPAAAACDCAA